jgi:TRAP transporter TAXI family solute receptor
MKRRSFMIAAAGAALWPRLGFAEDRRLSIVTGGTGGVYYPLGGGLANLLSRYVPGWQVTAEVTGGSVDNLRLVGARRADIGFTMADASLDAARGNQPFQGRTVDHKALAVLYANIMHVVTVEGIGINTLADLRGKRVSTGSPGSATEIMAFRVLEAVGLDKDRDVRRERLGASESTNALKDRRIDAYFWVGGIPTAAVTDLAATPGTRIRLLDHDEVVARMNERYGNLYTAGTIPAGSYPGQDRPNKIAQVWNTLVVHSAMPDDVAYNITKVVFDHLEEWAQVHAEARNVRLENQRQANSPVPFHPGAIRYFTEKGISVS